ncbi:MAG TPA: hypothetical protein ENL16_01585 [Candidatus Woesearchaeota archaeon]|nr:hypothetical protein [Candidatus Woesearchaeota archaeon]
MGKFLMAVIIMMSINIILWLTQMSIMEINPGAPSFFNVSNSPATNYITNGELTNRSVADSLPEEVKGTEGGGVTTSLTSFFSDPISTIKNFFLKTLGLEQVGNVLKAPYDFMKSVGIPQQIALMIAVLWYSFNIILLALVIVGRDN